jgi:hypothetical protein
MSDASIGSHNPQVLAANASKTASVRLKHVHSQIEIAVTPDRLWQVLRQYGDVSKFHAGVVESHQLPGNSNQAELGCERMCNIVDMGVKIQLMERIVDYREGYSYKYEIYEWKNFPISKMLFGFTIGDSLDERTILHIDIEYRGKPAWLTPLLAPKMRRLARDVLLGYKHHIETGEVRAPIKKLRKVYSHV